MGTKYYLLLSLILAFLALIILAQPATAPRLYDQQTQTVLGLESSSHPGSQKPGKHDSDRDNKSTQTPSSLINVKLPPMHEGLSSSSISQLRKLAEYENAAGGAVTDRLMIFTDIPANTALAESAGADMAATLKEFNRFGMDALVIMEPMISGHPVNFKNYRSGSYDNLLGAYFQSIKSHGVKDSDLGMWVYFPEANLPEWGPVDITNYAANVTRSVKLQKKYFPKSQSSILLDAMSYPAGSTSWDDGSYVSLAPFIKNIPRGLLDSFGMQGFPWVPPANQKGWPNLKPATFLDSSIAKPAAELLGTKSIWLNTGTFATAYANDKKQAVSMSPAQRQGILQGINTEASRLRTAGYGVAINLFSEDKSDVAEAIDWSYKSSAAKAVLTDFIKQLKVDGTDFWLFDA